MKKIHFRFIWFICIFPSAIFKKANYDMMMQSAFKKSACAIVDAKLNTLALKILWVVNYQRLGTTVLDDTKLKPFN